MRPKKRKNETKKEKEFDPKRERMRPKKRKNETQKERE